MAANAADTEVQQYAHPTLFGSQAHSYATTKANYLVGGEVAETANKVGVVEKSNVFVDSFAKDLLNVLKTNTNDVNWNPKMPVLRSELAVILAETFASDRQTVKKDAFKDITDNYWAKSWIDTAYDTNLMIGYPDGNFRPDQPVTKAEVFATIAQIVDVNIEDITNVEFKDQEIKYIPLWSVNATKEVIGSKLLEQTPDPQKVIDDEYLSKQQVAYLISALRSDLAYTKKLATDANAPDVVKKYAPTVLTMKMNSRVSARHSNVGEKFTAKTTKEVTIAGTTFPEGSTVTGEITEVKRPGVNHPGYIKVKFENIKDGKVVVDFPNTVSEATAETIKNPNILARICGAPFSATGRVAGIIGRSGANALNVSGDRLEELGDDASDLFVETLCLHPGSGVKSAGNGILAVGKGIVDITKTAISGTFGILYEVTDELVYLIYPKASNNSALNPDEELVVIF
ncbi:MAG: S-layer homology domain-containing protein [Candidatus Gastranaerophilales bacterium]|nr:S-layer homology domain-containing protein [Candidatus Gastranaerophilales bacterium]